jgi:hypothetical protein
MVICMVNVMASRTIIIGKEKIFRKISKKLSNFRNLKEHEAKIRNFRKYRGGRQPAPP